MHTVLSQHTEVGDIYPFGTIYVVSEGEEGVRADSDGLQ